MDKTLETVRRDYNEFLDSEIAPILRLDDSDIDELGFEEIAQQIKDTSLRKRYRRLAIELIEENLRDHQTDRPKILAVYDAGNLMELRDWQEVLFTWEKALWALASQRDA